MRRLHGSLETLSFICRDLFTVEGFYIFRETRVVEWAKAIDSHSSLSMFVFFSSVARLITTSFDADFHSEMERALVGFRRILHKSLVFYTYPW